MARNAIDRSYCCSRLWSHNDKASVICVIYNFSVSTESPVFLGSSRVANSTMQWRDTDMAQAREGERAACTP